MKLSEALSETLSLFGVSASRLSQVSGVGTGSIWEMAHGRRSHASIATVQSIARGLGKIDPRAKAYFICALFLEDGDTEGKVLNRNVETEHPEESITSISRVMRALDKLHLIARPTLGRWRRYFASHPELPQVEEWVSRIMKAQRLRQPIQLPDYQLVKAEEYRDLLPK